MTNGLITPELTPNAGEPTAPTEFVADPSTFVDPIESEVSIVDDGLPFTPVTYYPPNES